MTHGKWNIVYILSIKNNEGNRFYIFRKEKDGNSNQLRVAFKSSEDAKAWVNNVLIPAWQNWHDCNKLAGQVYLDGPDELNETKNINENMKQKQIIKLKESQLRQLIRESIMNVLGEGQLDEVSYGGESFHGNAPEDWRALELIRRKNDGWESNKTKRAIQGKRDLFKREFGEYAADKIGDKYVFPNSKEYDRANDWLEKANELGMEKGRRAVKNLRPKEIEAVKKMIENHETIYTKQYQGNGYYPIEKWVWENDGYRFYDFRGDARGIISEDELFNLLFQTYRWLLISNEPFKNEHNFNREGNKVAISNTFYDDCCI